MGHLKPSGQRPVQTGPKSCFNMSLGSTPPNRAAVRNRSQPRGGRLGSLFTRELFHFIIKWHLIELFQAAGRSGSFTAEPNVHSAEEVVPCTARSAQPETLKVIWIAQERIFIFL